MITLRKTPRNLLPQAAVLALSAIFFPFQASAGYFQTNLVSDIPGLANTTDPNLVNPWGISSGPTSPFWVSDNGTGLSTLYNTSGTPQALVVTVPVPPPPPGGQPAPHSSPTGQVFNINNGTNNTPINFSGDRFIFATEDGTIAGWQGGANAATRIDNSGSAVYKGLAIDSISPANSLYAANFKSGNIDVFDSNYAPVALPGKFTDPNLPAGYAPFNIQNLGGQLFVAYAQQDPNSTDELAGPGLGVVDQFDTDGNLIKRLITGGPLNAPWGIALAPADFGEFSGDLLVGNFGDGKINAFDLNGVYQGTLTDGAGNDIVIDGLWGLQFGNGGNGGATNKLYFAAGINDETHGLFGSLSVIPEPGSLPLIAIGLAGLGLSRLKRDQKT